MSNQYQVKPKGADPIHDICANNPRQAAKQAGRTGLVVVQEQGSATRRWWRFRVDATGRAYQLAEYHI
jgi:hypothetical protein